MKKIVVWAMLLVSANVWGARVAVELSSDKISPALAATLNERTSVTAKNTWAECFLRVATPPDAAQLKQLQAAGFVARSVLPTTPGAIVTGHMRLRDLTAVAALPFVQHIEGAVKVHAKAHAKGKMKNAK